MGASSLANLDLAVSIDTRVDYAPVGCFSIVSSGLRVSVQVLCHGNARPRWVRFCWRDRSAPSVATSFRGRPFTPPRFSL